MAQFNNQSYSSLVDDLLHDAFYIEARSKRGVIATVRQYSEVILRKILNLSEDDFVTLGNKRILSMIKTQSNNNPLLLDALKNITKIGNKCTHTQNLGPITEEDEKEVIDCLFNLYAYLFIAYFEKYRFGENLKIVSSFSILPPIIRYITLNYLYNKDNKNLFVIDKLSLAILKAFDKSKAEEWLNARKEQLYNMPSVTPEAALDREKKMGKELAEKLKEYDPNMYDLCIDRINKVASIIEENGKLYDSFESAIELYKEKGIIEGDNEEVKEFNSIMEFVYLGRKTIKNEKLKDRYKYFTF